MKAEENLDNKNCKECKELLKRTNGDVMCMKHQFENWDLFFERMEKEGRKWRTDL